LNESNHVFGKHLNSPHNLRQFKNTARASVPSKFFVGLLFESACGRIFSLAPFFSEPSGLFLEGRSGRVPGAASRNPVFPSPGCFAGFRRRPTA